ncbi:Protein of unknown function DUF1588 [Chthoniobacter flavus Ellin428]|uniref:Cytochrome c domain-containing protein n=1 Tax=Chthoniobacter flavus Ellin428 TaxID=497964 RepID=B4CW89_9BACT|nr:DUF1592 domain-containing protein [Chthoniobacter flavus]EDY21681.1 Protein of unknown function DUF1588 [Chthoniobacter flavus Ellin428]TCO95619.1 cytochrome c [Chthoniobacter flavus]
MKRLSLLALLLLAAGSVHAATARSEFLENYCADCHDAESKKGGLNFDALAWHLDQPGNFDEWAKVYRRVTRGEMPPKKKEQPKPEEAKAFLASLGGDLRGFDFAREASRGRTVLRRLNRVEYERTVQDLLGIHTPLADILPADTPAHGFDTVADGLRLSMLQMEKYLEAADVALDAAIVLGPAPAAKEVHWNPKEDKEVRKNLDTPPGTLSNPKDPKSGHHVLFLELPDAVVYFDRGYPSATVAGTGSHPAGLFKIRISAYGYQSVGHTIAMRVYRDNYREKQLIGWYEISADKPRVIEIVAQLPANQHIRIEPTYTGVDEKGQGVYNIGPKELKAPGLALQWAEMEGPLEPEWPPRSVGKVVGDTPVTKLDEHKNKNKNVAYEIAPEDPKAEAHKALETFAARAFRRPIDPGEIDRFEQLTDAELDGGAKFVPALRVGLRAILTAPQFLFFEERAGKLDDYALASRLSYFLWSTLPDEELLNHAANHTLSQPSVIHAQVERLLNDPRSQAFVHDFTGQWLDLRNIDATTPDKRLYPEADELLIHSMVDETESFFADILKENLPITNFVQSNFAMLNSRLAAHYDIPGVQGEEIRKVTLPPDSVRGGLLTQASVLKVTANGTTTSPVRRGAWVMKKLLGDPPPPPPPGIGAIEPDTRGATTVREQLAKHRNSETCAACHSHIDPPGFALESFDVIGGFREKYRQQDKGQLITLKDSPDPRLYAHVGLPVQCDGELADGRPFANIQDFKKLLLENPNQIVEALAGNLVTYSTGAGIGFADRFTVEEIAANTQKEGGGLRTLIHQITESPLFLNK